MNHAPAKQARTRIAPEAGWPIAALERPLWLAFMKASLVISAALMGLLNSIPTGAAELPWEIWKDLHRLAEIHPGQRVLLRSSRCPSGCRYDRHSDGDWRFIRVDGDEGVIFEEAGAGAITRIWMTMGQGVSQPLAASVRLRIYIDGNKIPILDLPLPDLFNGSTPPFSSPLVGNRETSSGGNFSYVPIPYRNGCRVTLVGAEQERIWYQFNHHRLADPGDLQSFSFDQDLGDWPALLDQPGQDPWPLTNGLADSVTLADDLVLAPGETLSLARLTGPDSLTALRFWLPVEAWPSVELRLAFDGNEQVKLPLTDFFAAGNGGMDGTRSLMLGVAEDGSLYSYFPMPFFRRAEISLESLAPAGTEPLAIEYELRLARQMPSRESGLFGAQLWLDEETPIGLDIPLLSLEGEGKWVGLFAQLGSVNTPRRDYLEGDERVFLDGSFHPEIYGTGTEDIFNGGFYFDRGPFRLALHGAPYHFVLENGEDQTSMYRLMLSDGVSFANKLDAGLEGGPTANRSLRARTVTYFYLKPMAGLWLSDMLDLGDLDSRATHDYTVSGSHEFLPLDALSESEPPLELQGTGVYRSPGLASFRLRAVPGATRLRLRRRLDAGQEGQEAEIWLNGSLDGRFPPVDRNTDRRWREVTVDLPRTMVDLSGELEITVNALDRPGFSLPNDSTFTAFTYELWAEVPPQRFAEGFKPTGVRASDGAFANRVRVSFNPVPGAVIYRVFRCLTIVPSCGPPIGFSRSGVFNDRDAEPGRQYHYRVKACTALVCGRLSDSDRGHRDSADLQAAPGGAEARGWAGPRSTKRG
jgi:hypothetical protein